MTSGNSDESVRRLEDPRLLMGRGRFVDDLGLDGQALDYNSAQTVEVNQMGKLDPIAESPAGGNNRVFEEKGTDFNSEVNPRGPGDASSLGRTHCQKVYHAGQAHPCGNSTADRPILRV